MRTLFIVAACAALLLPGVAGAQPGEATELAPADRELFETRIRPVLVQHCYECHNSQGRAEAGLALDHREAVLLGGERGPVVRPDRPAASRLLMALRSTDPEVRMPLGGDALPDGVVADFRTWIERGAPDPRDTAPSGIGSEALSWEETLEERRRWWSFQPIVDGPPPDVEDEDWAVHPVDRFLRHRMTRAGLEPAALTEPRLLVRRLHYVLVGLPPTPPEVERFVAAAARDRARAVEETVDRLLASPRFGERWARHWMDWMRYAESHGSEGDPAIPHAWRYRDYMIRALNEDVPYDQLLREHLAGDLVGEPRYDEEGMNESLLGLAFYRFVLHGFGPTDALDEQARFTENQIDVLGKAFQGLTVACARCHDHKFDAISQNDFYALYGIMASTRPATITIDGNERLRTNRAPMATLKSRLRTAIGDTWIARAGDVAARLEESSSGLDETLDAALEEAPDDIGSHAHPLYPWKTLHGLHGRDYRLAARQLETALTASRERLTRRREHSYDIRWDLSGATTHRDWERHGAGLEPRPAPPGAWSLQSAGGRIVRDVYPGGVYTHLLSTKHNGVLSSPRFRIDGHRLFVRVAGQGPAAARYVVQNYPQRGEVFPIADLSGGHWQWIEWDQSYWAGEHAYVEVATAADQPIHARSDVERSWFGITEAVVVEDGAPEPREEIAFFEELLFEDGALPARRDELGERYAQAADRAATRWRDGGATDADALFLSALLEAGLLPNTLEEIPAVHDDLAEFRRLEAEIPVPTRAPGILQGEGFEQPLFLRGNHKTPSDPVPHRFLDAVDPTPYDHLRTSRSELAESLLAPDNPMTRRVIVNRVWHHVFGRGLVPTPDNFGQMGETPSHPALLDHLASRFPEDGWSMKSMVRLLVTSRAFQLSSTPGPEAPEIDPRNDFLSHAHLRRLEAEAIRDTLLAVSGRLDPTMYGPAEMGNTARRSVYVRVKRNELDPFLTVFDMPNPVSTKGRRDTTNVPAQALALMNDPFVLGAASDLGRKISEDRSRGSDEERVEALFRLALGRLPSGEESTRALDYVESVRARGPKSDPGPEADAAMAGRRARADEIRSNYQAYYWKLLASMESPPEWSAGLEGPEDIPDERLASRFPGGFAPVPVLEAEIELLEKAHTTHDPWRELAHAVFHLKELVYLR